MKLKTIFTLAVATLGLSAMAKEPFGTVILNGGKLEPVSLNMIGATNEHMNFCFATDFEDGSIYLDHSQGIHTVSEYKVYRRSLDGGKTWEKTPFTFGGINAYTNMDGKKCHVNSWEPNNFSNEHTLTTWILKDDHSAIERSFTSKITMPFKSNFLLHRDVIRTQDGRLLLNGYCRKVDGKKHCAFVIESKDDGKSWQFLSMIFEPTEKKYTEGANETTMVQLKNGDILAFFRTGGPLVQMRSKDGGKTWGDYYEIDDHGVAPGARVLENGTIVVISGRPETNLYIDFTGEGKDYQCVQIYGGAGCSYASVIEVAPNQVMCIYDESDFGSWKNLSHFSRVMGATYNIVKDDNLKFEKVDHPKAKEYKNFYFAGCMQGMDFRNAYTNYAMLNRKDGEAKGTWCEIQKIAERPHPVLHMEFKGTAHPFAFSHYYANLNASANYKTAKIGFEIRLSDMSEKKPQFMILCRLKEAGGYALVRCGVNGLECVSEGKTVKVPYTMGFKFHSFRVEIDSESKTYKVFDDQNNKELFTGKLTASKNQTNFLQVGDGSNQIYGAVDLSYLGYTFK